MPTLGFPPGCLPATVLCADIQSGGCGFGRVTCLQAPGSVPPAIARIATVRDGHPEAAVFAGGYPLSPKAKRRPHSSPTRRRTSPWLTPCRDLYSVGEVTLSCMPRSFAPVLLSGEPSNVSC